MGLRHGFSAPQCTATTATTIYRLLALLPSFFCYGNSTTVHLGGIPDALYLCHIPQLPLHSPDDARKQAKRVHYVSSSAFLSPSLHTLPHPQAHGPEDAPYSFTSVPVATPTRGVAVGVAPPPAGGPISPAMAVDPGVRTVHGALSPLRCGCLCGCTPAVRMMVCFLSAPRPTGRAADPLLPRLRAAVALPTAGVRTLCLRSLSVCLCSCRSSSLLYRAIAGRRTHICRTR